jgi:hypothetical protein
MEEYKMTKMTPLATASLLALSTLSSTASAAILSASESFDSGIVDWSTTLANGGGTAVLTQTASGGEDGGADISQTGDVFFGACGPTGVVFRCNNQGGSNCSGGSFFGDYDPVNNDTVLSFYLRHDAGVDLDFFARLAPSVNSPGAGTGNDFTGTVASGIWTELSLEIESNYFDSFSGTDFDTVFANTIERLQIGVTLPFNGTGFDPLVGVTYDLDSVSLSNTPVPIPASAWLFGSALFGLVTGRKR